MHRLYLRLEPRGRVVSGPGRTYTPENDFLGSELAFGHVDETVFYQNVGCGRHGDIRHQTERLEYLGVVIGPVGSTRPGPDSFPVWNHATGISVLSVSLQAKRVTSSSRYISWCFTSGLRKSDKGYYRTSHGRVSGSGNSVSMRSSGALKVSFELSIV